MFIKHISAKSIKGWQDFETDLAAVNVAAGANGTNKTSFLSLVTALFGRGNPRMLRAGAAEGEICAVVEGDGGETWKFSRTFEPGKVSATKVRSSKTGPLGAPATWLKQITDSISIDPINEAMNASEEKQTQILLETVKLELDEAKLMAAVADASFLTTLKPVVTKAKLLPALDAVKMVEDHVYDKRTDLNRDSKIKATHAGQLRESIGTDEETDWSAEEARLLSEKDARVSEEAEQKAGAERQREAVEKDLNKDAWDKKVAVNADYDEQIRVLNAARAEKIGTIESKLKSDLKIVADTHQGSLGEISGAFRAEIERLTSEHSAAKTKAASQIQDKRTREIAEKAEQEALALKDQADKLTASLNALDSLRDDMLDHLPISGLTFDANKVAHLNGVPLSEVNTQARAQFWLRVAAMRAGEFGVVCCDGLECFDDAHFASLVEAAKQTGLQWFLGRVDSKEFRIEKVEA